MHFSSSYVVTCVSPILHRSRS